jgi:hypothetical protein
MWVFITINNFLLIDKKLNFFFFNYFKFQIKNLCIEINTTIEKKQIIKFVIHINYNKMNYYNHNKFSKKSKEITIKRKFRKYRK